MSGKKEKKIEIKIKYSINNNDINSGNIAPTFHNILKFSL